MSIRKRGTNKSLFTTQVSYPRREMMNDPIAVYENEQQVMKLSPVLTYTISPGQHQILQRIHDLYTVVLANRSYDKIPTDYDQYITFLNDLKTIDVHHNLTLRLLLEIAKETLIGAMNVTAMHQSVVYNDLQVLLLNKRIDEIMKNKNMSNTVSEGVTADFALVKVFKLSPVYSYYIQLYGMPAFGVGFDPDKLAYLQRALGLFDAANMIGSS